MPNAATLRSDLGRADPLDVAAGCAALIMLAENWPHAQRLHSLASYVLDRPAHQRRHGIEYARWARWLRDSPSLSTDPPWDPPEGLLTEPVLFFGGTYVLATGGEPEPTFALQLLLDTLVFANWPEEAEDFRRDAFALATASLTLGHSLSTAAGLPRYAPVGPAPDEVLIPSVGRMTALTCSFSLSTTELENLLRAPADTIAPLEHDLAAAPLPERQPDLDPLDRTPLVRRGERHVIAAPHCLVVAIRHALISLAIERGWEGQLAAFLAERSFGQMREAAKRMWWEPSHALRPTQENPLFSGLFTFDRDKVAHVAMVCDDLADYQLADARGNWHPEGIPEALTQRMAEVEGGLTLGEGERVNEFVHIVLLAGVGRQYVFGLPDLPTPCGSPHLLLTAEAFDRITMSGPDQLELWKFARAAEDLRDHARVLGFNALDEYALWKDHTSSFYFGDEQRPTMVVIDASWGRSLREKVAATTDVHAVRTPSGTTVTVVRLNSSGDIPIYAPLFDLAGRPRQVLLGTGSPIWTVGEEEFASPAHRSGSGAMVDCITYWLWQLSTSLPDWSWLGDEPLCVEVMIENPESWEEFAHPDPEGEVAEAAIVDRRTVRINVLPAMVARMDGPDNGAERDLMAAVLAIVSQLARDSGGQALTQAEAAAALDRHAPLGPKKKINMFRTGDNPVLRTGNLPRTRLRQDADSSTVLDEMASILLPRLNRPIGPLPPAERGATLNAAVDIHYQILTATVATLQPEGLLEDLLARQEGLLRRDELQRRILGSRVACFQETTLIDDLVKHVPAVTTTSIALRFLIEYVAACPPSGLRPLSLGVYDTMIAHASEIVNRGIASDVVKNELDDIEVSVLGSGRLGMSRDGLYEAGQQTFLNASMPVIARQTIAAYASHWKPRVIERPTSIDELDDAARAEFGFTMSDLGAFFAELVNAAERRDAVVAIEKPGILTAELAVELDWDEEPVQRALAMLSLGPRHNFLQPPAPFRSADVYPWLFNRELSYLRKPVLIRSTPQGAQMLWGMRHVWLAGQYLLNLILSERLHAHSLEMKHFMSKVRQEESAAFNEQIAELCREQGMVVRTQVSKVGPLQLTRTHQGHQEKIGDVDVLAADRCQKVLYVLECKNLEGARTPSELKNEIDSTFSVGRSKRSKLEIHVERIAWVEDHLIETLELLGLDEPVEDWTIDGRMITDIEVLSPHIVADTPIPVLSAASLRDYLERGAS